MIDAIGASGRLLIWEQGLNMAGGSPLVGSGPGVYSWVRLEFPPASADLLAVRLLHNVPLLTLVEGGVVLVVGVAVAAAIWAVAVARNRAQWRSATTVTIAALAGFAAAALLDDFSFLPSVTAAVLALAAWLVPVGPADNPRGWVLPALSALAAVAAVPSVIGVDVARGAAQGARTAMVNGAYADAVAGFDAATRAHPENGGYWLGLGMAAPGETMTPGRSTRTSALPSLRRAILAHTRRSRPWISMPMPSNSSQQRPIARWAIPSTSLRLGAALAFYGRGNEATRAWGRALALQPELLRRVPNGFAVRLSMGSSMRRHGSSGPSRAPRQQPTSRSSGTLRWRRMSCLRMPISRGGQSMRLVMASSTGPRSSPTLPWPRCLTTPASTRRQRQ